MGVVMTMAVYRFHDVEPVFKYFMISIGSSFLLVISLLMCGKKGKKNETPNNSSTYVQEKATSNPIVEEEIIEAFQETSVECQPESTETRPRKGTPPTQAILPKEPLRKVLSSISTNGDTKQNEIASSGSTGVSPYDTVKKNATPVFECSGNSDSGNSIYAKVKDVPVREETAYAVVDIDRDKDYEFVNGELVRKTPDKETVDTFPVVTHYDRPKSNAKIEIIAETENSGASGIYECVTDSNKENVEPSINTTQNSNDLYDLCGPAAQKSHEDIPLHASIGEDATDTVTNLVNHEHDESVKFNSLSRKLHAKQDLPRRGSSKESLDKSEKEESRLSRYLKFTQSSKKQKKQEETIEVDIEIHHSSNKDITVSSSAETYEDKAPPAPSITKLKQLSAHRREHGGSVSDRSHSPEPSVGGSSPTDSTSNQLTFVYDDRSSNMDSGVPYGHHHDLHLPHHRSRLSDGCIPTRDLSPDLPLKTPNSLSGTSTQVAVETTLNKDSLANHIHLVLEKTQTNKVIGDSSRGSLISEPDYAEIESRSDTSPPAVRPPVVVNDSNTTVTKGYTEIDFRNGPIEIVDDDNGDVSGGYAVVDFSKKSEDRRIRDLYAAVDFSLKRPRDDTDTAGNIDNDYATTDDNDLEAKYEGPYDIIPENKSEDVTVEENIYDEFK